MKYSRLLSLDQYLFLVDEKAFEAFVEALDHPPIENTKLKALLGQKAPWEP